MNASQEVIDPLDRLVDENEAADYLGIKRQTLAVWRCTKRYDLPYCKVGRSVRYRIRDLNAFVDSRMVAGT